MILLPPKYRTPQFVVVIKNSWQSGYSNKNVDLYQS